MPTSSLQRPKHRRHQHSHRASVGRMESGDDGGLSSFPRSPEIATAPDGEYSEEDQVMSEVHLGCPPNFTGPYISRFTISLPPFQKAEPLKNEYECGDAIKEDSNSGNQFFSLDDDGDLVLTRRKKESKIKLIMTIQHTITSSIPRVGLQVWKAELLLADFVLHQMFTSSEFNEVVAVELGAGTGLVGILLARVAKSIFLTDVGDEVLNNCARNVQLNAHLFPSEASIYVRELDWKGMWPPEVGKNTLLLEDRYTWVSSEVEELHRASLLVASDVIYSDDLTDAFFSILERLMQRSPEKVLYMALEKRYNFTLDDLGVVANGYLHFRSYLRDEGDYRNPEHGSLRCFVGKCLDVTQIPQYVREYDRGNDVELWQIKYRGREI